MVLLRHVLKFVIPLSLSFSVFAETNDNALAEKLGWVTVPESSTNYCGGYYNPKQFPQASSIAFQDAQTVVQGNPPITYQARPLRICRSCRHHT